jgi:hypothetical protein
MSDHSPVAPHDAAGAVALPPGGHTPRLVRAQVVAVNEGSYHVAVKIAGDPKPYTVSYNPLAYIPRERKPNEPGVWLAVIGEPENWWVLGEASRDMAGTPDIGRAPSACLRRDSAFKLSSGRQNLPPVTMTGRDWDTDHMIRFQQEKTTRITLQRTGLYTIKAGGRWNPKIPDGGEVCTWGARGMDLRWAGANETTTGTPIARDEKGPNDEGECAHSVSVDVMITDIEPTSPRVGKLDPDPNAKKPAVVLAVYQTSGRELEMLPGAFLQATYQGPKP